MASQTENTLQDKGRAYPVAVLTDDKYTFKAQGQGPSHAKEPEDRADGDFPRGCETIVSVKYCSISTSETKVLPCKFVFCLTPHYSSYIKQRIRVWAREHSGRKHDQQGGDRGTMGCCRPSQTVEHEAKWIDSVW